MNYELKAALWNLTVIPKSFPASTKEGDVELPDIKVGDVLTLEELHPKQHFTKPAPRYTEASLVKELENAVLADHLLTLPLFLPFRTGVMYSWKTAILCTEKIGDIVTERLQENFTNLLDYGFTAQMEAQLDDVANGKKDWLAILDDFYASFTEQLARLNLKKAVYDPISQLTPIFLVQNAVGICKFAQPARVFSWLFWLCLTSQRTLQKNNEFNLW